MFHTQFTTADQLMRSVATAVQDGAITDDVAVKALNVSSVVVANMKEATRSGQTSDIVAATVTVYRGITEYVNSKVNSKAITGPVESEGENFPNDAIEELKLDLKTRAGEFCDALTDDSAPDALPFGSSTNDFLFSCQKVQKRGRDTDDDKFDDLVFLCMQGYNFVLM